MTDRDARCSKETTPRPAGRLPGASLRPVIALLAVLIPLMALAHQLSPLPTGAVTQSLQATPGGSPLPGTPAASAADPCSVVLGIGAPADACVAFVNALPGGDPVDVTVTGSGDVVIEALAPGAFADFVAVPGETDLALGVGAGETTLVTETVRLAAGTAAVIVLGQQYDQVGPTVVAVPLDLAPLSSGQARVAFHHAVTDAADLAVLGLDAPSDGSILPGETTEPVTLEAGPVAVTVVPANAPEQVLATLDLVLESDLSYLVIVGGTTGDQTVTAIYAAAPVAST